MNLEYLGVSAAKRRQFGKREIFNVEDLLSYLPRKYNDYSTITGILPSDQVSCIKARVVSTSSRNAGTSLLPERSPITSNLGTASFNQRYSIMLASALEYTQYIRRFQA